MGDWGNLLMGRGLRAEGRGDCARNDALGDRGPERAGLGERPSLGESENGGPGGARRSGVIR